MSNPGINTLASVVYQFFAGLDNRDNKAVAALMARDGVWVRQGSELQGQAAVQKALETRDPQRYTAHIVTNLWVENVTPTTARVRFYMTAYEMRSGLEKPEFLGTRDCVDDLRLEEGGWRILRKESRRIMPPEA
ncbi:nuclear transport factor 2 family protein [Parapusillimonas granuli]|uniref:Nuclear transport factor 2 family protein n=1 Tax=Parapusillimonas granuli TaxID=380911 RepID=A0A853FVI8_9BURK|nr:nuclear transport factor 2 family protein [Parapusillimonas granuli]MBB5215305.1 uncharacterized protein (TIGR02246 family) [Parapusillimonas granuli]NYT50024.1 nuclear transport factor 2 family protein [Parapusillimonas granuli]